MSVGDLDPRGFDVEVAELLGESAEAPPVVAYTTSVYPRVRARRVSWRCRFGWHRWRPRRSAGVDQCVGCGRQRA